MGGGRYWTPPHDLGSWRVRQRLALLSLSGHQTQDVPTVLRTKICRYEDLLHKFLQIRRKARWIFTWWINADTNECRQRTADKQMREKDMPDEHGYLPLPLPPGNQPIVADRTWLTFSLFNHQLWVFRCLYQYAEKGQLLASNKFLFIYGHLSSAIAESQ